MIPSRTGICFNVGPWRSEPPTVHGVGGVHGGRRVSLRSKAVTFAQSRHLLQERGDLVPTRRAWGRQPPLSFQAEAAPPKRAARRRAVTDPSELRLGKPANSLHQRKLRAPRLVEFRLDEPDLSTRDYATNEYKFLRPECKICDVLLHDLRISEEIIAEAALHLRKTWLSPSALSMCSVASQLQTVTT